MAREPLRPTDLIIEGMTDCGKEVQALAERAWRGTAGMVRRKGPTAVSWLRRRLSAAVDLARGDAPAVSDRPRPGPGPGEPRVQRIWSRLITDDAAGDEGDLIYEHLLAQLTTAEARILDYACRHSSKFVTEAGFIAARPLLCAPDRLREISAVDDLHQLDRDLDHLRSLELLSGVQGGFDAGSRDRIANLTPTALALNLYVRCQGSAESPLAHFGLVGSENPTPAQPEQIG